MDYRSFMYLLAYTCAVLRIMKHKLRKKDKTNLQKINFTLNRAFNAFSFRRTGVNFLLIN